MSGLTIHSKRDELEEDVNKRVDEEVISIMTITEVAGVLLTQEEVEADPNFVMDPLRFSILLYLLIYITKNLK